jgi:hypothetical protein
MKVEVDADELCELRRRARENESAASYIRSDRERIIRDSEAIYSENTRLKKELDEKPVVRFVCGNHTYKIRGGTTIKCGSYEEFLASIQSLGSGMCQIPSAVVENEKLKKELDEALAEMSELRKIGKELKDRADMVYEWWRDAERRITNLMRLGGCK